MLDLILKFEKLANRMLNAILFTQSTVSCYANLGSSEVEPGRADHATQKTLERVELPADTVHAAEVQFLDLKRLKFDFPESTDALHQKPTGSKDRGKCGEHNHQKHPHSGFHRGPFSINK